LDLLSFQDKLDIVIDNLKKFFDNIFDIEYEGETQLGIIKCLISEEKEQLKLGLPVLAKGVQINAW